MKIKQWWEDNWIIVFIIGILIFCISIIFIYPVLAR